MHGYICVYEHTGKKNSRKPIYAVLKPNLFEATELGAKPAQDEALPCCTPQLSSAWVLGLFSGCLCFIPRFQPAAGLMERIQAIAQNVSDIAIKVDQILRNSLMSAKSKCPAHSRAPTRYKGAIGRSCPGELGKNAGWMLICGYITQPRMQNQGEHTEPLGRAPGTARGSSVRMQRVVAASLI